MTDTTELTDAHRFLGLAAVITASFSIGLSFGIGLPLTALTFEAWQEPMWMIGLAGAAPSLGVLVALPLVSRVVARTGALPPMLGGCVMGVFGFLAMYLMQDAWSWVLIRFVMSAGIAFPWLIGETWINVLSREETRGRIIAAYAMALFLGISVGPAVLQVLGLTGYLPFLGAAVGVGSAAIPLALSRGRVPAFRHSTYHKPISVIKLAPVAMVGGFVGGFADITCFSLIPNVALAGGLSENHALSLITIMAAGGLIWQFFIGWLSDRIDRALLIFAVAAAFVLTVLALPLAMQSPLIASLWAFVLGGTILGFYTVSLAIIGERVPAAMLIPAHAAFLMLYQVGAIAGPVGAGVAMTASPIYGFIAFVIGLTTISSLVLAYIARRAH